MKGWCGVTLTELRYLVVLAEELNFIRAAEKLHISQPTLSIAIKKLEDYCGGLLFERSKTELKLTVLGEKVLAHAKIIQQDIIQLDEVIKQSNDPYAEPFRLGAIHTCGPYLFPLILPEIKRELNLPVYIYEDFTHNLGQKLLDGELDAIIVAEDFDLRQTIKFDLFAEEFYFTCSREHKLANNKEVRFNQIKDGNLLVLGEGNCFRDQVLASCPTQLLKGSEQIIASSMETIRYMVNLHMGISIFPYLATLNKNDDLSYIKLVDPAVSRKMILVARTTTNKYKILKQLVEIINQSYQNVPA